MDRRKFVSLIGTVSLGLGTGCLDPLETQHPARPRPRLIGPPLPVGGGAGLVTMSQWPFGADAAAVVSADDLCPVDLGDPYDFGGSWTSPGDASMGLVEGFVTQLLQAYPRLRFSFYTIAAMKHDPRTDTSLPRSARLSLFPEWCRRLQQLQQAHAGLVLGWHGYSHFNQRRGGPTEFSGYDAVETVRALDAMEAEARASGLVLTRGFRPPGWAITDNLLNELGARGYILADNSALPTYAGSRPSYISTADGQWLFRIGVTLNQTPAQVFAQGGMYVAHHHMTPPNVNTLTDPAIRSEILRFVEMWYDSQDPQIVWLSPDEARDSYDAAAAVNWGASMDGSKVRIDVLNSDAVQPGLTWHVQSSSTSDVEVYSGGTRLQIDVVEKAGMLKAWLS